ncbi:uncharacterized protein G2W53_010508 [Senna tora]|uniref:Uncharacterized protein n=1 Tax=Senna tora TaxID=362788 RepID=A0A835C9T4_9FABA|nr:uncharacterized protein G2W53_010508 [Senna tora]
MEDLFANSARLPPEIMCKIIGGLGPEEGFFVREIERVEAPSFPGPLLCKMEEASLCARQKKLRCVPPCASTEGASLFAVVCVDEESFVVVSALRESLFDRDVKTGKRSRWGSVKNPALYTVVFTTLNFTAIIISFYWSTTTTCGRTSARGPY